MPTPQSRLALRLTEAEMIALATVSTKIASPLRRPPSTSEAIRAALLFAASAMPALELAA